METINNSNIEPKALPQDENKPELDIKKILEEIKSEQANLMTPSGQLKRLLNTNFITPYEVLMINHDATEEEIKKQYRQLSMLVHPDKCQESKASDAFHVLETAYKTLQDAEKKKFFQRIIREAKERVEIDRKKENKLRLKKGQPPLPDDTLDTDLKKMIKKVIEEIEERKEHSERLEASHRKREREEEEFRYSQEEYEKQYNKEWESYRDKRVKNWNKFQNKITNGKRKGKYETRPPRYKTEERIEDKIDVFRPNTII
jgi:DnaJ family protein C protein 8